MTIIRARRTEPYSVIRNGVINDHRLSFKARGLLVYILSKPDGWRTNSAHLAQIGPDGRDAVRTGLEELRQAGYLDRTKAQDAAGRWSTTTTVYDHPAGGNPVHNGVHDAVDNNTTEAGFSDVGDSGPVVSTEPAITHLLQTPVLQDCPACLGKKGWNGPDGGPCDECQATGQVTA